MPNWIRKRFDSTESDSGAANCEDPPEDGLEAAAASASSGGSRRALTPEATGTTTTTTGRFRTTSLSYESETSSSSNSSKKVGSKVKSQWQKAVRKLSINSSGYSSSSSSQAGSLESSRTSMEKPGWALKQQNSNNYYQPRSRHLSINADSYYTITINPIPEAKAVGVDPGGGVSLATSLPPHYAVCTKTPSPPPPATTSTRPPYLRARSLTPSQDQNNQDNKSRNPSSASSSGGSSATGSDEVNEAGDAKAVSDEFDQDEVEVDGLREEFPFGPAFKAAMGRMTTFPDGTEAVMIDSAKAHEAFQTSDVINPVMRK